MALGQAGNQVGASFFETLAAHESGRNSRCLFRTTTKDGIVVPRAVLVDTEPKVVQAIVARPTRIARAAAPAGRRSRLAPSSATAAAITLRYDLMQTYCRQSGSANNWAFGFRVHGPLCWAHPTRSQVGSGCQGAAAGAFAAQPRRAAAAGAPLSSTAVWTDDSARVSELVRREVERCDEFEGFLVLQSAAGGTGSGVGTFVTRALRDEYRTAFICNALVWPFAAGEVIVQNYNCALALAHVTNASDAVIVLENDAIGSVAHQLLRLESPTFSALNSVIARQLASVFLPTRPSGNGGRVQRRGILADPIRHLCAHPGYKLLGIKLTPTMPATSHAYSQTSWASLAKQLRQMQVCFYLPLHFKRILLTILTCPPHILTFKNSLWTPTSTTSNSRGESMRTPPPTRESAVASRRGRRCGAMARRRARLRSSSTSSGRTPACTLRGRRSRARRCAVRASTSAATR